MIFYIVTQKLFTIFMSFLSWIYFAIKYYGFKTKQLPPIENEIILQSASSLAACIRSGKYSSEEVVSAYIDRIKTVNPTLNSLVADRFEESLKESKAVDDFINNDHNSLEEIFKTKPLLGVPFTIKDAFAVKGLPQTCGMFKRRDYIALEDAEVVRVLKNAGAICLGVTNVPEMCFSWENYNMVYGLTKNPYDSSRSPGGSSGGEASLISACGSIIGIGSDLGGSIRIPSCYNGIFGHKPTPGIISTEGHFPDSKGHFNTTGPLCRYATDLITMLKVLSNNAISLKLDEKVDVRKLKVYYMLENSLDNATVGVDREIKAALLMTINYLKSALKIPCKQVQIDELGTVAQIWFGKVWELGGPKFYLKNMMKTCESKDINIWKELLKCLFGASHHTIYSLLITLPEKSADSFLESPVFTNAEKNLKKLEAKFKELLDDGNSVFIYPTNPLYAPYQFESVFKYYCFTYTGIFNVLGFPSTACPLGLGSKGLPLGIQIVGLPHKDSLCIAVAEEMEKAFGGWVSPSDINI